MQQEVGLARAIAPEVEVPAAAPVRLGAADFGADERFPERAGERRRAQRAGRAHAAQEGREAGVAHVQLGPFDERLRPVREPGLEQHDLMRRFERRQPGPGRRPAYAGVAREVRAVEQLRGTQRRHPQKALEVPQVRHLEDLAEVSFQVRRHVRAVEPFRVDLQVLVQLGEAAPHHELVGGEARAGGLRFGERERFEGDDRGAAGQRVGNRLHEAERLRPGEQEGAAAPAFAVHRRLQMPEEPGRVLHLVDDHRRRMAREKGARVAFRLLRLARQVEGDEGVAGEQPAHQARLPGLAGAGQHDDGPRRGPLRQERLDLPVDPHRANSTMSSNDLHDPEARDPPDGRAARSGGRSTSCEFYDVIERFA